MADSAEAAKKSCGASQVTIAKYKIMGKKKKKV